MSELDYGYDYAGYLMNNSYGGRFAKGKPISYEYYVQLWKGKHGGSKKGALAAYRKLHGNPTFKRRTKRQSKVTTKKASTKSQETQLKVEKLEEEIEFYKEEIESLIRQNEVIKNMYEELKRRFIQ